MDILKSGIDWAKAELVSTPFFILFGLAFIAASIAFWLLGKTDIARAYIIPTLVAGGLLTIIGLGLFFTNKARVTQFEKIYQKDPTAFVATELERAQKTVKDYTNVVFTAIPLIIAGCALVLVFVDKPLWRASMITTIAMLVVILLVDGTAQARLAAYQQQLIEASKMH
jgi:hypothetical protein